MPSAAWVRWVAYDYLYPSCVDALVATTNACRMFTFLQIRTLGMLRSRFEAIPRAFGKKLVPRHDSQSKRDEPEVEFYKILLAIFLTLFLVDLIVVIYLFIVVILHLWCKLFSPGGQKCAH